MLEEEVLEIYSIFWNHQDFLVEMRLDTVIISQQQPTWEDAWDTGLVEQMNEAT